MLLDEALVHFQDVEDLDAACGWSTSFPRLLVFRTFSKIYGLSGLRRATPCRPMRELLAAVAPVLGINALSQAAVEYALRSGDAEIDRRRAGRGPRAPVLTDGAARARRRRDRQPGQLPLDPRAAT